MSARRRGGEDDWDAKAKLWAALVALLAAPALVSPLALMRLPDAFPTSLAGALKAFVGVSSRALLFAGLAAAAAGLASYRGGLAPRVLIAIWAVVVVAAATAATTAGRLAAYGL